MKETKGRRINVKFISLKNGDQLSKLGMGTWHMDEAPSKRKEEIESLRYGFNYGLTVIDTAEMYGSEKLVGEAIASSNRDSLYLISKFSPIHASRKDLEASLDQSLDNMGVDYLDLYLYHWRGSTPLAETVEELERFKEKGKIKAWGVSNFDTADMEDLLRVPGGEHCQVNQILYHLGERGPEYSLLPYMKEHNIRPMAYSPLAQAGSISDNQIVQKIAEEKGISSFQVLLLFVLAQDNMIAIPKTSSTNHMKDNCECSELSLTRDEYQRLNKEFPAPDHKTSLQII